MKISISKTRRSWVTWLIVLALAGYPVAAVLVSFAGLESRAITVPYRVGVFSLATVLLLSVFLAPLRGKPSRLLLVFFTLYSFRLIYDAYFADNPFSPEALLFFLIATAVPTLATAFTLDQDFNERAFATRLLLLTTLGILGYYFLLWSGRISVEIGVRASLAALNPIALGHLAATAIIAAIYHVTSRPTLLALLGSGPIDFRRSA